MSDFKIKSNFKPNGDQPGAIRDLSEGIIRGDKYQTLLGVTGSGKTFTIANVIEKVQKPTLIMSHNKTLAAQLYNEFKQLFQIMPLSFLYPTMITTSQKHIFQLLILILIRKQL